MSVCNSGSSYSSVSGTLSLIFFTPGIVFNFVCVICISQILWHKSESGMTKTSNMFKYLLVKCLSDFVYFFNSVFLYLFYCGNACNFYSTKAGSYWLVYGYIYLCPILYMVSCLSETAAILGKTIMTYILY
jgi:hypothetical protein